MMKNHVKLLGLIKELRPILLVLSLFTLTFCVRRAVSGLAAQHAPSLPQLNLSIEPVSMDTPSFLISGSIEFCTENKGKLEIIVPQNSSYKFTRNGQQIDLAKANTFSSLCSGSGQESGVLQFSGESGKTPKCEASGDEIYCLNHSAPNPEIASDRSLYNLRFTLPNGYAALTPDSEVSLNNGIAFQIAKLGPTTSRRSHHFSLEYNFPQDFQVDTKYFTYLESALDFYADVFGTRDFSRIKVGAIRRDEKKATISGSPDGNLILFSRTTFRDPPDLAYLSTIGIKENITEPLRYLVIAHEASHFWFGDKFLGQDGWMVEGIPQYLGLQMVRRSSMSDYENLLKQFNAMNTRLPQTTIPRQPLGDGIPYATAYWQAPLALTSIGEAIGQEELIHFLAYVFSLDSNPAFQLFDEQFKKLFPTQIGIWNNAWRLDS